MLGAGVPSASEAPKISSANMRTIWTQIQEVPPATATLSRSGDDAQVRCSVKAQLSEWSIIPPTTRSEEWRREKKSRAPFSTTSVKMRKSHTAFMSDSQSGPAAAIFSRMPPTSKKRSPPSSELGASHSCASAPTTLGTVEAPDEWAAEAAAVAH